MCQYLRMYAAMIMMAAGVPAHAEQIDYNPAKVSDSLKAIFQFGSVSTKKALNANTVTLLTGRSAAPMCSSVPTSLPFSTTTVNCASCRSSVEARCRASPIFFS